MTPADLPPDPEAEPGEVAEAAAAAAAAASSAPEVELERDLGILHSALLTVKLEKNLRRSQRAPTPGVTRRRGHLTSGSELNGRAV